MLVSHFASIFIQLSRFSLELISTRSKKAKKFLKGLRADIYDEVAMMGPATYVEALENA